MYGLQKRTTTQKMQRVRGVFAHIAPDSPEMVHAVPDVPEYDVLVLERGHNFRQIRKRLFEIY